MGAIFYTSVRGRSCAASTGLGVPIFNLQAGARNSIALREIRIGGVVGAASSIFSQNFEVRVVRNATVFATEGGSRTVTTEALFSPGAAANATVRMGVTAAAAATEGGKLLFADSFTGSQGFLWTPDKYCAPQANISKNIAVLFHATDTTVINATVVHEELSKAS
jgi:hypothetical protein